MTIEQKLAVVESFRAFIATLVWPVVVILIIARFAPQLREFFNNLSEVSVKAPGVETTVKRKIEAAAALGAATAKTPPSGEPPGAIADARNIAALVEQRVTPKTVRRLSGAKILWVDDHPENNTYERHALEALGINFTLSESTDDALKRLQHDNFDLIISDMRRGGDPAAGLTLLEALRKRGDNDPLILYSSLTAAQRYKADIRSRGAQGITSNPSELFSMVSEVLSAGTRMPHNTGPQADA
jgi:CheY-like chemotaxis protein